MKDNLIKAKFSLPNYWNIGVLGNLTNQIVDGTHFTPKYTESGMPFLRVTDVQTKEINFEKIKFISLQEHEILKKRCNPSKGDLLLSKNGTIGIPKIVDWDWEFSIFVSLALIKLKGDLDINYLYHFFKSNIFQWQIIRRAKQGTVTNLHLEEIRELEIPLLSLPQQQKIAKILSTCDEVIEKTEAAIAKYKAIKQGMMHDLFTRGIDVSTGKLRPSYQEAQELYKASELGMIPKDWEVKRLEELTQKISDGIHTTPKYVENSAYHFINGNNLSNGVIEINSSTNCVSYEEYLNHKQELSSNTILYSINGTIGKIAIYKQEKVVLGKSAAYFCFNDSELMDFIYHSLQTEQIKKNYDIELTGSTIKNLSINSLRNTLVKLPSSEEFIKITTKITSFDEKLQIEESSLSKYKKLKEGLMQDLLTGKVEVSE